ncbi:hypothetical protein LTS08_002891 [Lithohypha guttulata]|nr:hypothetical protein LTS08_002891 [Lithohypha guttulata]
MGPFGTLTEQNRRWKDLRFEVHYISPHLVLVPSHHLVTSNFADKQAQIRKSSYTKIEKDDKLNCDTVYSIYDHSIEKYLKLAHDDPRQEGWKVLLNSLVAARPSNAELIGVQLRKRAWDAFPDDLGKAIASTTLHDILVIARRMGAGWQSYNPSGDGLRSEGGGHAFVSTDIRGLGTAVSYQGVGVARDFIKRRPDQTDPNARNWQTSRSWTSEADKFIWGVASGNPDFALNDFVIRDSDDVITVWNNRQYLDIPWQRAISKDDLRNWRDLFKEKDATQLRHATNDLIALACPMLRCPSQLQGGASVGQILLPFAGNFENMFQGYTLEGDRRGRQVFLERLEQELHSNSTPYLAQIQSLTRDLANHEPKDDREYSIFLDRACTGYEVTSRYFKAMDKPNSFYWHLMRAHLSRSPFVHGEAMKNHRKNQDRERKNVKLNRRRIRCEQVHLLFDSISHFQHFMKDEGFDDAGLVKEAWILLFFRGMCWSLCHTADELGEFLPLKLYGSQTPIFLL